MRLFNIFIGGRYIVVVKTMWCLSKGSCLHLQGLNSNLNKQLDGSRLYSIRLITKSHISFLFEDDDSHAELGIVSFQICRRLNNCSVNTWIGRYEKHYCMCDIRRKGTGILALQAMAFPYLCWLARNISRHILSQSMITNHTPLTQFSVFCSRCKNLLRTLNLNLDTNTYPEPLYLLLI